MLVGSPLLWLLPPLLVPPEWSSRGSWQTEPVRGRKKNRQTRRRGEAPSVYCVILVRRAAGAEWLLLVFIGAY